jgi:hypothetical protein
LTFSILSAKDSVFPFGYRHLHLQRIRVSSTYARFCRLLMADSQGKLWGLSFTDVELNAERLLAIQPVTTQGNLRGLAFVSSIHEKDYGAFVATLLDRNPIAAALEGLRLETPGIMSLSLASCDLDIYHVFKEIASNRLANLRFLNLSNNRAESQLARSLELPPQLQRLWVNDDTWSESSLVPLVSMLASTNWLGAMELSIEGITASDAKWNSLNIFYRACPFSIGRAIRFQMTELSFSPDISIFFC